VDLGRLWQKEKISATFFVLGGHAND